MVQWKGAKVSKIKYYSEKGAQLRVNFWNDAEYDLMAQEYVAFLAFTKKNCARDFTDALIDGRVTVAAYDFQPIYLQPYVYQRIAGRHTSTVLQFNRLLPSGAKDLGNFKKDRFFLSVEGLDRVDFGTKTLVQCLESVVAGTWNPQNIASAFSENYAYCAANDKDLGW